MKKQFYPLTILAILIVSACSDEPGASKLDSYSSDSVASSLQSSTKEAIPTMGIPSFSSSSLSSGSSFSFGNVIPSSNPPVISSSSPSSSSSSQATLNYSTIEQVKTACSNIADPVNSAGYVAGTDVVKVKAKFLAIIDSIATKTGYNVSNRYKAYVQDASGSMYVAINEELYKKVKDYVGQDNTVYTLTGRIGRYYDQPELVVDSYKFENETLPSIQPISSFEEMSLSDIKTSIAALPISEKGVSYGKPIVFEATYIDELVQENLLFSDGNYTIQLHGSSRISNGFAKGATYRVAALLSLYSYKPSLQYIGTVGSGNGTHSLPTPTPKTGAEQYAITYSKDTARHSSNYENEFYGTHSFTGYVSSYTKDSKTFFVLSDNASTEYNAYTNALNAKTLFVNNPSEKDIYSQNDLSHSILYPYFYSGERIEITYTPYLYNTSKYWMVFADLSSIQLAD